MEAAHELDAVVSELSLRERGQGRGQARWSEEAEGPGQAGGRAALGPLLGPAGRPLQAGTPRLPRSADMVTNLCALS